MELIKRLTAFTFTIAILIGQPSLAASENGENPLEASRISQKQVSLQKMWAHFLRAETDIHYLLSINIPGRPPTGEGMRSMSRSQNRTRTTQQVFADMADAIIAEETAIRNNLAYFTFKGERHEVDKDWLHEKKKILANSKKEIARLMAALPDDETRLLFRLVSDQQVIQRSKEYRAFQIRGFDVDQALDPTHAVGQKNVGIMKARLSADPIYRFRPASLFIGIASLAAAGIASANILGGNSGEVTAHAPVVYDTAVPKENVQEDR